MGDTPKRQRRPQDHRLLRLLAVVGVWVFVSLLLLLCVYAVTVGLLDRLT